MVEGGHACSDRCLYCRDEVAHGVFRNRWTASEALSRLMEDWRTFVSLTTCPETEQAHLYPLQCSQRAAAPAQWKMGTCCLFYPASVKLCTSGLHSVLQRTVICCSIGNEVTCSSHAAQSTDFQKSFSWRITNSLVTCRKGGSCARCADAT